ncbi:MAG: hypothetical protein KatS3mg029_1016 [Saprospiraceae bacterium]|nr:MAG: hypothetical protein KatS3mg029_1016 [Saprospiraceae bacterium]
MKTVLIILLLFPALLLSSQSKSLVEKSRELNEKRGAEYVTGALELVDALHAEHLFQQSAALAESAFKEAKKIGWKEAMADARFKQAHALVKLSGEKNKRNALEYLDEALTLAATKDQRRKILEAQKVIAMEVSDKEKLAEINRRLQENATDAPSRTNTEPTAEKNSQAEGGSTSDSRIGGLFNRRRRALEAEKNLLTQQVKSLNHAQQQLLDQLNARERMLEKLTLDQMRKELILSEQARLLDSMVYTALLDSLELANKNSQLREKTIALEKLDAELALRNSQRNLYLALATLVFVVSVGLFLRNRAVNRYNALLKEKNQIIEAERQRSESLLLNILPENVATELKTTGAAKARRYEGATIMFLDFKDFTNIAKRLSPEVLVDNLHEAFSAFDDIVAKHGVEKIKTIGDAYMCAAGLDENPKLGVKKIVSAAKELQSFLNQWNERRRSKGLPEFHARIGIHTGPVVAGVVGKHKFAYDIWGDTVNVAARMENASEPGKINISEQAYTLLKDEYRIVPRGQIQIKHGGQVEMFYLLD